MKLLPTLAATLIIVITLVIIFPVAVVQWAYEIVREKLK